MAFNVGDYASVKPPFGKYDSRRVSEIQHYDQDGAIVAFVTANVQYVLEDGCAYDQKNLS